MLALVFVTILNSLPVYEVEEVVITATRYPTSIKDVALATVVLDRAELQRLEALSLGEILRQYAGIEIKDYGTPGSVATIAIRGIQANGVLVLINGHPLNSISTGVADLNGLNRNGIERIEIVKGPVSSLYGANGLAGVVNIITRRDYDRPVLTAGFVPATTTTRDPFQTREVFFRAGSPVGRASAGITAGYVAAEGYRHNSDLDNYSFQGDLGFRTERMEAAATFFYDDKDYGLPGPCPLVDSLNPVPHFGDSTVTSLFDRQSDQTLIGNVQLNWQVTDGLAWHNNFFADRRQSGYRTVYAGWAGDTIIEDYDYLTHTVGINTMMLWDVGDARLVFGIDGHYDTLRTIVLVQAQDTTWQASSYNFGAWFEAKKGFRKITFIPSVRFDHNSRFGDFVSPQFGMIWAPLANLIMKFSVARAFRAPTFNDLYWPIYGNPGLKPEHGWAYEARLESSPIPALFTALSFYLRSNQDRISWLPAADGLWRPENVNALNIKGMDLEMRCQVTRTMRLDLDLTVLKARQRNNELVYDYYDWAADTGLTIIKEIERTAAFTPEYAFSSAIHLDLPYQATACITASYISRRLNYYSNYTDYPEITMDEKVLDPYFLINAVLSKRFFNILSLALGAKNILDTEYAVQFGNTIDDLDYPMPGRTFFARLGVDY